MPTPRQEIHQLVDRLAEGELHRVIQFLSMHPAERAVILAPVDDEPLTPEEEAAVLEVLNDPQPTIPHEDILREFGQ